MTDGPAEPGSPPLRAGERLRQAREAQGLSLAEVAARTRVPLRQLEAIENADYSALPSVTYSVGFAKAYARAVGVDEVEIAREVRAQGSIEPVRRTEYITYDDPDAGRLPRTGLAVAGAVLALLVLIGVGLWYGTDLFRGGDVATPAAEATGAPVAVQTVAPAAPAVQQVRLAAGSSEVWMRVYDADNKTLYLGTLKPGEGFDVPADARNPMINVGRPDQLTVTVNGSAVPPLGSGRVAIKNVPVSAAALLARGSAGAAAAGASAPAPAPATPARTRPRGGATEVPPFFADPAPAAPTGAQAPPGAVAPAPAPAP
ncbi:helix-turn-helix domain-containing protein [Sphingomonas aracearum]|uniref:Helix-turn-helix domain-containing protein n=1 Tax=Sphingomonas aracearum TaxID=2283317 RepID=A0A369VTX5_9SPHN|nr:helix-turn-helix domain-containing protein [Sphingomonas aracearum]RDE04650.1 helix-turn-helix domain-containing protein [Sphingomonas aracearum]